MPSVCPYCRASLAQTPLPPTCPICGGVLGGATAKAAAAAAAQVLAFGGGVGTSGGSTRGEAHLAIRTSDGQTGEFPLAPSTRIGRHPVNTLRLADREISKEHAEISKIGAEWWVVDLGSSNGTFVNGKRIDRHKLADGDEIVLGGTRMTFKVPAARTGGGTPKASSVTMVQSFAPHVLASVRADTTGFRPEAEIVDVAALRRDYEKLRIASEFHRQVGLETNLHTLYEKILKFAFETLNAETGVVLTLEGEGETADLVEAAVRQRKPGEVMLSKTLLDKVVQSREGVLTQDAIIDSRFSASASIVSQGIRSAMAVPLLSKNELRGVLYIDTRERVGAFGEKDLRILSGVATQAAIAMENAELAKEIEREVMTRTQLARYLSPELVDQVSKGQIELSKGGALNDVTILFADIRGFTSMTEKSAPQEVVELLNSYFEQMVDVIFSYGGVLDKFIGDCIMAGWGTLVRREDDPARAVRAAVDMQLKLEDFNAARIREGRKPVHIGIGINTGQAVVGNMGSSKRLEYTVIGDSVNLASRLCSLAKAGEIIISQATLARAGDGLDVERLPPAKVKGKEQPIPVYRVNGYEEHTRTK